MGVPSLKVNPRPVADTPSVYKYIEDGSTVPFAIALAEAETPPYKSVLVVVILIWPAEDKVCTGPLTIMLPANVGSVIEANNVPAVTFKLVSFCTRYNTSSLFTTLAAANCDIFKSAIKTPKGYY